MASGAGGEDVAASTSELGADELDEEWTPLEALLDSSRFGELEEVQALLTATEPVDVNGVDASGSTALHLGVLDNSNSMCF